MSAERLKVLLPSSLPLDPQLPPGVEAIAYDPEQPVPVEHRDAEVLVVWGNRGRHLREAAQHMPNLRLVQGLMAGPDQLLRVGFGPDVTICSGVGLHDQTVSEHALALVLALVRRVPQSLAAQREHRWATELAGAQPLRPAGPITTMLDARVLIWGFGSIGTTLAPLLAAMGATVTGAARSAGERAGFRVVDDSGLAAELARTDILVMLLPASEHTENALNAERLRQLKRDAYLVNVGRGVTVDETALLDALASGRLGGAALDVMQTEPLPPDSPLWDAPNVLLTPHNAGGRPVGVDDLIATNVRALLAGGSLRNVVA
ncbi:phosphoglycerate dehydrogenase [Tessaracoccus flavus]|uniref:phosphoglycerate dehydrogenase n=1 Tax=Tessaracoccus flavus TaxID=1610493 RepID=UPI00089D1B9B|nr:phosphoglycerate dehydrogenase [Tessaracoccus flavus]SDY48608.1 Phosphoglycerate dehydrogenase [Tessaracoccus flavus]